MVTAEPAAEDFTDFWTVIVASLPTNQYDYDDAYSWATDLYFDTSLWADVLLSDLYYTLSPGYWVGLHRVLLHRSRGRFSV